MTCSFFRKDEKFIQNFVQDIWKEEATFKTLAHVSEYKKNNFKGTDWESMNWIYLNEDGDQWQAPINCGNKPLVCIKVCEFFEYMSDY
jgi:hypothetical protein